MAQKVIGIFCFNRRQIIDKSKIEPADTPGDAALEGLGCLWFDPQALSASHTNHDPEDLLESIEVFRTRGYRAVKKETLKRHKRLHKLLLVIICL